jgi:hypothetical protein
MVVDVRGLRLGGVAVGMLTAAGYTKPKLLGFGWA